MGQVNVTYDDALVARIDALAEQRRMTRPDLLRALALQAAETEGAGQGSPEPVMPAPAMDAGALRELVASLERMSMELDRTLRDQDRREKRMVERQHVLDETIRAARERLGKELSEDFRTGSSP